MVTIKKLIEKLQTFDSTLMCYAYEGEVSGIVIVDENKNEKGFIMCSAGDYYDESEIDPDFY